jgi:hypothetical protein
MLAAQTGISHADEEGLCLFLESFSRQQQCSTRFSASHPPQQRKRSSSIFMALPTDKYVLQVEARWFIGRIAAGSGLVLNPGLPVTFEMPAAGLDAARRDFGIVPSH